jgi:signal transduction histidine kinase
MAVAASAASQTILLDCAAVRALSPAEIAAGVRFEITGTFLHLGNRGGVFHDGTTGCWLNLRGTGFRQVPANGQRMTVRGVVDPGNFAPVLGCDEVTLLPEPAVLPPPAPISYSLLNSPSIDCQWIEAAGVVLFEPTGGDSRDVKFVPVFTSAGLLRVSLDPMVKLEVEAGSWVRLRGVALARFDGLGRFQYGALRVIRDDDVLEVRPADPDQALRQTSLAGALGFHPETGPPSRVIVTATVTGLPSPGQMFVQDEASAALVHGRGDEVKVGDRVAVTGFPNAAQPGVISFARWQKLRGDSRIEPIIVTDVPAISQDGKLACLQGEVLSTSRDPRTLHTEVLLASGIGVLVESPSRPELAREVWPVVKAGARVSATGILRLPHATLLQQRLFTNEERIVLWLRSPADLTVIQPAPWPRGTLALAGLSMVASTGLLVGGLLFARQRRRLVQQRLLRERTQLLSSERARLARELHDNLAQGLTTVSMRLNAARARMDTAPEAARNHLLSAQEEVRHSLERVREAIHGLRPQLLERLGLVGALEEIAHRLAPAGEGPAVILDLQPLSEVSEELEVVLLYLAQEALTNAVKHAESTTVTLRLRNAPHEVELLVQDDGKGLPSEVMAAHGHGDGGHLGITSMQERASAAGVTLQVLSSARGTTVRAVFPRHGNFLS